MTEEQVKQHKRITRIILPETLQYIGEYAFSKMLLLKDISIPNGVMEIDQYAFSECQSLRQITIPGTVKKIGKQAFYHNPLLEKVCICEGVMEIDECAFMHCNNLQEVRIPRSVQHINTSSIGISKFEIFEDCPKLTVYCPKGSKAEEYCREKKVRFRNEEIPDTSFRIAVDAGQEKIMEVLKIQKEDTYGNFKWIRTVIGANNVEISRNEDYDKKLSAVDEDAFLYYETNIDFYPVEEMVTLDQQIKLAKEILKKFADYGIPAEIVAEFECEVE